MFPISAASSPTPGIDHQHQQDHLLQQQYLLQQQQHHQQQMQQNNAFLNMQHQSQPASPFLSTSSNSSASSTPSPSLNMNLNPYDAYSLPYLEDNPAALLKHQQLQQIQQQQQLHSPVPATSFQQQDQQQRQQQNHTQSLSLSELKSELFLSEPSESAFLSVNSTRAAGSSSKSASSTASSSLKTPMGTLLDPNLMLSPSITGGKTPIDMADFDINDDFFYTDGSGSLAGTPYGMDDAVPGSGPLPSNINYSVSLPVTSSKHIYSNMPHLQPSPYVSGVAAAAASYQNYKPLIQSSLAEDTTDEKRRKRRESHNAVERRRRDNINEKITELSTLLPAMPSDVGLKPNKGAVLRRSVEYIRAINVHVNRHVARIQELESVISKFLQHNQMSEANLHLSVPLGTPIHMSPIELTSTPNDYINSAPQSAHSSALDG